MKLCMINKRLTLTESEKNESWRHEGELLKAELILKHSAGIPALLDITVAWVKL